MQRKRGFAFWTYTVLGSAVLWSACGDGAGGGCPTGQVCTAENPTPGEQVDLNGDGTPDGRAVDSNHDGVVDGIDTNGDGIADVPWPPAGGTSSSTNAATGGNGSGTRSSGESGTGGDAVGDAGAPAPITVKSDWCDALGVLRASCQECHSRKVQSTAPMPLDTYEDLMQAAVTESSKKVYQLVSERIHDANRPMPEPPRTLSSTQLAALDKWVADGARPGPDATCAGSTPAPSASSDAGADTTMPAPAEWPADCDEHYKITAGKGQPYVVPAGAEQHLDFIFDAPWGDQPVQAVAFLPITDNRKVLHHWILYQNGGATTSIAGGTFLTGWSPGKDGMRNFPSDIGVGLPGGKQVLRLNVHYYNKGGATAEPDQSGVEICVTRTPRKNTAGTFAFGTLAITLPPNQKTDVTAKCRVGGGPVYLLNSSPHMHELGYWAKFWKTSGGQQTMLQDTAFNFEFQEGKALDRVPLQAGDSVSVVCSYNNTTSNTVRFGQNTEDEMCFNFALYYPNNGFSCTPTLF